MAKPRIFMICTEPTQDLSNFLVVKVDSNGTIQAETSYGEFMEVHEVEEQDPEAAD